MTETRTNSGHTFWNVIGMFFKVLLRLLFVIVIGILVGVGLYFGVPWLYHTFVRPVQENTARLTALEQRVTQDQTRAQAELQGFEARLTALETALQEAREEAAARDVQLASQAAASQATTARVTELETEVQALEAQLQAQAQALETLQIELESAQTRSVETETTVYAQVNTLEGRIALLQTAQSLLRVRLLLLEDNPRAAIEAVGQALGHLERAHDLLPESQAPLLPLLERLKTLQTLIEQRSFRVGLELEALWAEVMELVLPPAPASTLETLPAENMPPLSPLPTPPGP